MAKTVRIMLALGSNLSDRLANLKRAREELACSVTFIKESGIYETPPWGYADQPAFLNQVLSAKTALPARDLLRFVKEIERKLGRVDTFRNGPRVIDIDILLYGDQIIQTPDLIVPHPRMLERGFVLVPLAEIAPRLIVPGQKLTVTDFLKKVDCEGIRKLRADEEAN